MADVTRLIGIDFGTSTSVVCVKRYKDGEPLGGAFLSSSVTFGDGQGDNKAMTAVRRNADGSYTCGREAGDDAAQVFREFKMDLESPDGEKRAQARTLTEAFFKYLYRWYDHQRSDMGEAGDEEKTIVSFPAKWSEETRAFMAQAARDAGFPSVGVMDEPSAALYATLTRKMNDVSAKGLLRAGEPGYMLLIDMGAGTTDLAVCRYTVDAGANGVIRADQIKNEIVSTWPESAGAPTFGGREVDRLLEDYLTDYMTSCGLDPAMARQLVCGTASVKPWKETVVSPRLNEGNIVDSCGFLSGYMMLLPKKQPFPSIDRAKLEELLKDKLDDFKSLVTGCLDKAAKIEPAIAQNGVDLVILTGGHSAWYFTEELLNGALPGLTHPALQRAQEEKTRVLRLSNPQETVALGLVYSLLPLQMPRTPEKPAPEPADDPNETAGKETDQAGELPEDLCVRMTIEFFDKWARETRQGVTITRPSREQICFDGPGFKWGKLSLTARKDGLYCEQCDSKYNFTQPWSKVRLLDKKMSSAYHCTQPDMVVYIRPYMQVLDDLFKQTYQKVQGVADEPSYQEALRFVDDWMKIDFAPGWRPSSPERGVVQWTPSVSPEKGCVTVKFSPTGINFRYDGIDETVSWNDFKYYEIEKPDMLSLYMNDRKLAYLHPLDMCKFESFMTELHLRIRGRAIWKPQGPEKAGAVGHLPDNGKKDIEDFILQNRKNWYLRFESSKESVFRSYLHIPNNVPLLLAEMDYTLFQFNYGKDGWALTREGIHAHGINSTAYSWESFAGPFSGFRTSATWDSPGMVKIALVQREEILDFFLALRTYVRGLMGMD